LILIKFNGSSAISTPTQPQVAISRRWWLFCFIGAEIVEKAGILQINVEKHTKYGKL
jgi:hypothetical protein